MPLIEKIRAYHIGLIALTALSYVTGEAGAVHTWLGYGVAGVILFRMAWGVVGPRQVGISRFFPPIPDFKRTPLNDPAFSRLLISAVALVLILVTATGVMLDPPGRTAAERSAQAAPVHAYSLLAPAYADDDEDRGGRKEEVHEFTANLLVIAVALHVPKSRRATRPTKGSQRRRLEAKGYASERTDDGLTFADYDGLADEIVCLPLGGRDDGLAETFALARAS